MAHAVTKAIVFLLASMLASSVWANPVTINDDVFNTVEDNSVSDDVLNNDVNDGSGGLRVIQVFPPALGSLSGPASDGKFDYVPPINFSGEISFSYIARSEDISCSILPVPPSCTGTGNVSILVHAEADLPNIATASPIFTPEDTASVPLGIVLTEVDVDGSQSMTAQVTVPANVTLSAGIDQGGGVWSVSIVALPGLAVQLPPDENGPISVGLDIDVTDSAFTLSTAPINVDTNTSSTSIDITVTPVNDAPTASLTGPSVTTDEDVDATASLTGVFDDVDIATNGDSLSLSVTGISNAAIATATMAGETLQITLTPDAFGVGSVEVTAQDQAGATASFTVPVTVNSVNDAPVTVPPLDPISTLEDTDVTVSVGTYFDDVDGDSLTYNVSSGFAGISSASMVGDTLIIVVALNFNGTGTLDVTATDPSGEQVVGSFSVEIAAVNDDPFLLGTVPPIVTDEDVNASVSLAGVFDDPDIGTNGDSLSLAVSGVVNTAIDTAVMSGTTLNITVLADANDSGSVDVTATDDLGATATITVLVDISPINDAPVVFGAIPVVSTPEDTDVTVDLSGLFADVDGDVLVLTAAASHVAIASATMSGTDLDIVVIANANGNGTVDVVATDPSGETVSATINVGVGTQNDPPTIVGAIPSIATDEDVNVSLSLATLFDDVDIGTNGDNLTLSVTGVANSAIDTAIMSGSSLDITLLAEANGSGDVDVTATDDLGASVTATIPVTVTAVNDTPTISAVVPVLVTDEDVGVSVDLSTLFGDVDIATNGDSIGLSVTNQSHSAIDTVVMAGTTLNISLLLNEIGVGSVEVTATDIAGATVSATLNLTVNSVNDIPTVVGSVTPITVDEDSANTVVALNSLFDDVDITTAGDSLVLSVASTTGGIFTSAVISGSSLTIDYEANQNGAGSVTVVASDTGAPALTASYVIGVTVNAINDMPEIVGTVPVVTTDEDVGIAVDLAGLFEDVDVATNAETLSIVVSNFTHSAIASASMAGDTLSIALIPNLHGVGTVDVTATDSGSPVQSVTATINVTVNEVNDLPFVSGSVGPVVVDEDAADTTLSLIGLFDDIDIGTDGDSLSVVVSDVSVPGLFGSASVVGDDLVLGYVPEQNGISTVTLTATDSGSPAASVDFVFGVTVNSINDAPIKVGGIPDEVMNEDDPPLIISLDIFDDVDVATNADVLTYSVVSTSNPGLFNALSVVGDELTVTLRANQFGNSDVTIRVTDIAGEFVDETFNISVTSVNDIPVAEADSVTIAEDSGAITLTVLANDFLAEEPTMITSITPTGDHSYINVVGDVVTNPNGTVTFTGTDITYEPALNFSGEDTFDYTITDSDGDVSTVTVTVTVTEVNDPPFLVGIGIDAFTMYQDTTIDVNAANGVLFKAWDIESKFLDEFGNEVGPGVTAQIETLPSDGVLSFNGDGSFTYTPLIGFVGSVTFYFRIFDNIALSPAPGIPVTIDVRVAPPAPTPPPAGEVATPFNLAQGPLEQAVAVPPNVLVVMDTSGSMDWHLIVPGPDENGGMLLSNGAFASSRAAETSYVYLFDLGAFNTFPSTSAAGYILPDQDSLDAHFLSTYSIDPIVDGRPYEVWRARASEFNRIYYNPKLHYEPWTGQDLDNNDFADADITGLVPIRLDPIDPSRTFDLLAPHGYRSSNVPNPTSGGGSTNLTISNVYLPHYYLLNGDKVVVTTDTGRAGYQASYDGGPQRDDCSLAANMCTPAEELQNFANWFQYYRSREYITKGSIGSVIANVQDIRVGYETISNTSSVPVSHMNDLYSAGNKKVLLDNVYSVDSFGGTPLRQALARAGKILNCSTGSDCPALAPPEGQCQQNFALLFTDGYWNGGSGVSTNADGDDDSPFDGTDVPLSGSRYGDDYSATLADVAMHYYETDLFPTVDDEVPVGLRDVSGAPLGYLVGEEVMHQHMKTYTIAFGIQGTAAVDPLAAQLWDVDTPYVWSDPFAGSAEKIDDLVHTAINGRGTYFSAGNPQELRAAFEAAFLEFTQAASSASAAAFNSTSLSSETLLFRGFYDLRDRTGELTATEVDVNGNFVNVAWSASEELDSLPSEAYLNRTIVTYNPVSAAGVPFRYSSLAPQQQATMTQENVDYIRGSKNDESPAGLLLRPRVTDGGLLGPIVNSSPVFVGAPRAINRDQSPFPTDDLYSVFAANVANRTPVVYVGANDGMLHGFKATSGEADSGDELFAYVPNKIIDSNANYANELHEYTSPFYFHNYYVDLSPRLNDVYMRPTAASSTKQWMTVLLGGLGAGGKGYFALNVNNPDTMYASEVAAAGAVLWEFTDDDDTYPVDASGTPLVDVLGAPLTDPRGDPVKDLGYATSLPFVQLTNATDSGSPARHEWGAAFGNGMNSTSGIAKLFVLFIDRGVDGWASGDFVKIDTGFGVPLPGEQLEGYPNGLGAPTAVDSDLNGTVDYAYAGDRIGNLFRFDMTSNDPNDWHAVRLFSATYDDGTQDVVQPILARPLVIKHPERRGFIIIFGTGSYLTTDDAGDTRIQSVYGIWDTLVASPATAAADTKSTRLVEQVMTNVVDDALTPPVTRRIMSKNPVAYAEDGIAPGTYGWYFDLDMPRALETISGVLNNDTSGQAPPAAQFPGERAIRRMVFRNGSVITTTVIPATNETSCTGARGGAILVFDAASGGNAKGAIIDFNRDGVVDDNDLLDVGGESFSGGLLFDQDDLDGTLVDLSTLGGAGDTDLLFVSGGNDTESYRIAEVDGGRTGRLSWVELDEADQ